MIKPGLCFSTGPLASEFIAYLPKSRSEFTAASKFTAKRPKSPSDFTAHCSKTPSEITDWRPKSPVRNSRGPKSPDTVVKAACLGSRRSRVSSLALTFRFQTLTRKYSILWGLEFRMLCPEGSVISPSS